MNSNSSSSGGPGGGPDSNNEMDESSISSSSSGGPRMSGYEIFTQVNLDIDNVNDCDKNPINYEGKIETPIFNIEIEPGGRVTPGLSIQDVLLDPLRKFIKVPEIDANGKLLGYTCYEKSEFIYHIKTEIVKNIIKKKDDVYEILSPIVRLPIPKEIIEMLNSLFHIDSFISTNIDIVMRNQESYDTLISPTFYYNYGNPNNYIGYDNILFLNKVYQYFTTTGELLASHFPDDVAFAQHMIKLNLESYLNSLFIMFHNETGDLKQFASKELKKFSDAEYNFLPFVTFNKNSQGDIISYDFHFENHPYFMPEFRDIFTGSDATDLCNRTERRPGVQTRSGKQILGNIIDVHPLSTQYTNLISKMANLYRNLDQEKRDFVNGNSASGNSNSASGGIPGGSKKKKKTIKKKINKKKKKRKTIKKN
jgi:hypothetical protein